MFVHQISIFRDGLAEKGKLRFDMQHLKFRHRRLKHGTFWARLRTRGPFGASWMCSCIGPVPTTATKVPSSPARALLPVASGSYGLLCTSGFHRPLDLCEGRQSWRQPNGNQSATSNCNTHDPVTRRLHRQHLDHHGL
jgi:hypothetical protein